MLCFSSKKWKTQNLQLISQCCIFEGKNNVNLVCYTWYWIINFMV